MSLLRTRIWQVSTLSKLSKLSDPSGLSGLSKLALIASAACLGGCAGYTSEYAPLDDGRARAVYRDDQLVMEVGGAVTPECANAVVDARSPETAAYVASHAHRHTWVPVYYGPPILVLHGGLAPTPHRPRYAGGSGPGFSGLTVPGRSGGGTGGPSSSGGGGGLGNAGKEVVVIIAVIAIVAMPAIAIGLAVGRPEPEKEVAAVIDRVNLYNDMARTPGSPCALYPTQAAAQAPSDAQSRADAPEEAGSSDP